MYKDKAKQREYQRLWVAQRRNDYFFNKICVKCGSLNNLELDHVNPNTKITNSIWSWTKARREAELAKCQVLCSECHSQKTAVENRNNSVTREPHGTRARYDSRVYKCRCELCCEAHAKEVRIWKESNNYRNQLSIRD